MHATASAFDSDPVKLALLSCVEAAIGIQANSGAAWATGAFDQLLKRNDAFRSAVDSFSSDQEISPRLGRPFMCVMGGVSELRAEEVISNFVRCCIRDADGHSFAKEQFDILFEKFMLSLRKGQVRLTVSAGIEHCWSDVGEFSIGDYQLIMQQGSIGYRPYKLTRIESVRYLEQTEETSLEKSRNLQDEIRAETAVVLDLIRLITRRSLSAPQLKIEFETPSGGRGGSTLVFSPCDEWLSNAHLRLANIDPLRRFTASLAQAERSTRMALRRFGLSRCEFDQDEKIFHLMSASEALFLSGEQTESANKLALRGAFFLGQDPNSRRAIFNVLKTAYGVRSSIAHGDSADKKKRIGLDGARIDKYAFAELIDNLVAAAILVALCIGTPKPDWESLIIGDLK